MTILKQTRDQLIAAAQRQNNRRRRVIKTVKLSSLVAILAVLATVTPVLLSSPSKTLTAADYLDTAAKAAEQQTAVNKLWYVGERSHELMHDGAKPAYTNLSNRQFWYDAK